MIVTIVAIGLGLWTLAVLGDMAGWSATPPSKRGRRK